MWEGRERAGGESGQGGRRGAVQSEVRVPAEGGRGSHQQRGGCDGSRAVQTSIGVRGFMGTEAVSRDDGGAGGLWECRGEGGCGAGVEVIGGDDGAFVTTLTLRAGAAGRVVRRVERRRCTLLVRRATRRW